MPFPRNLLNEGEEIVLDLKPHWWFMIRPILAVVGMVALAIVVSILPVNQVALLPVLGLGVLAVLWLGAKYAKWTTTQFVLTTDRLIARSGVLAKRGLEIPLERINNIGFNQTVFERMLRSGDLLIESAGEGGQQSFSNISRPSLVQNAIYRQMEAAEARDAERLHGRRELSLPEQLDKLDDLRRRGVISQAEFDAKKTQLLDRM